MAVSLCIRSPRRMPLRVLLFQTLFLTLLVPAATRSQEAESARPTVPPEDYGKWEVLERSPRISADGRWLAYRVRRVDRESETRVRALDGDTEHVLPWGETPEFSADSAWLAWTRGLSEKEKKKLAKAEEPERNGAGVLDLASGEQQERDAISRLSFDDSGGFLALLGYPPKESEGKGADLVVLDLAADTATTFGNVGELAWSEVGSAGSRHRHR